MAKRKKPKPVRVPEPEKKPPANRLALYLGALGVAGAVAATLVTVSLMTGGGGKRAVRTDNRPVAISGVSEVRSLLSGIPQHGTVLGSPRAPVTLVEYADPQCPYCAQWAQAALPEIVKDYVRPGRVRIEFRGMAFLGPESKVGLAAALAAGRQGKLWHVVDLLYANQGPENGGWINDQLVGSIANGAGIPWAKFDVDRNSAELARAVDESTARGRAAGVTGTPTFLAGPTGGSMAPVPITSLDAGAIRPALDQLLGSA
jgi:hypothetical protein